MTQRFRPITPEDWFRSLFRAKAALDGGVVRRKIRDMERMVGRDRFEAELKHRGFSAVENAGQVVVFCNAQPIKVSVSAPQFFEEELNTDFQRKSSTDAGSRFEGGVNP